MLVFKLDSRINRLHSVLEVLQHLQDSGACEFGIDAKDLIVLVEHLQQPGSITVSALQKDFGTKIPPKTENSNSYGFELHTACIWTLN